MSCLNPPPSALLWDIDGTLIDTTDLIVESLDFVFQKYFRRILPAEEIKALIGTPLRIQMRLFGEPEDLGVNEQQAADDCLRYYEARKDREILLPDVIDILKEGRRRGIPTGIITSKSREELSYALPRMDLADTLDLLISADDVARPKPDPEGMRLAVSRLRLSPEAAAAAVYIGDTVHDIRAARGAGLRCIAVTWGAGPRALLEAEYPAGICDTPQELRMQVL